jgi:hypothetical protein
MQTGTARVCVTDGLGDKGGIFLVHVLRCYTCKLVVEFGVAIVLHRIWEGEYAGLPALSGLYMIKPDHDLELIQISWPVTRKSLVENQP